MSNLSDRVRLALSLSGKSQTDIAKECGIAPASVNNWLSGITRSMKAKTANAAAKSLGVSVYWLSEGKGAMFEGDSKQQGTTPAAADQCAEYLAKLPPGIAAKLRLDIKHAYERWQLDQETDRHSTDRLDDPPQYLPKVGRSN